MPAYIIARAEVVDPEGMRTYRDQVPAAMSKHGGRFLVRGPSQVLEGDDDAVTPWLWNFLTWIAYRPSGTTPNIRRFAPCGKTIRA